MTNKKLLFIFLPLLLLLLVFSTEVISQCCYNGWNFRAPLTVVNPNTSAITNFEVMDTINTLALITAGKMKNDGSDLRFSDSLCNNIPYWIESGINTAVTKIWFKVHHVPANSVRTIYMYYGNPSATAVSNPRAAFKFFEGFDSTSLQQFTADNCGSGTNTVSAGNLNMTWPSQHVITSDSVFPGNVIYTAEADVVAANGNWPEINWQRTSDQRGYGILIGSGSTRISETGESSGYCQGHNWASALLPYSSVVGLWSITWVGTADQRAVFPTIAPFTATSTTHTKDTTANLKLVIGGCSSGSGDITINWIRARKWAPMQPFGSTIGVETTIPTAPSALTAIAINGMKITLNWIDNSGNEDKFYIQRSTNGGSNWSAKDSVNAGVITYTDSLLISGQIYCYRVNAGNCRGVTAFTAQACDTATTIVGISGNNPETPRVFALYQNYPNPFNPVTNIKFDIPKSSFVKLTIYDALGRVVTELVNKQMDAGSFIADWNASQYASGVYFYRIEAGDYIKEMKMILVK
jgi:hypothetical protein